MPSFLAKHEDGTRLELAVQPNARKTQLVGEYNQRLKIRISSPPADGKANAAIQKYLSKLLGISKSKVIILLGKTGRTKTVLLRGVTPEDAANLILENLELNDRTS